MPGNDRTWRQLTVWLHVVTSLGWMALALTLLALLALSVSDPAHAASATAMAHFLDTVLLAPLANASASTGLVLSLGTAWGLIHQRWVLTKFALTLGQLYAGIFLLSDALGETAATVHAEPALVAGTAAMAGALGFQAWLSVTKPWPRTRWARHRDTGRPVRLPTAPAALFAAAVLAPLVDIAVGTVVGFPTPVLSLLSVVAAAVVRRRALRAPRAAGRMQYGDTAAAIGETRP
ncbi:hypothetical protein [Pseudonocardia hierapolitana]|uniref:hypothetical protein n=1 Tax=Pseudonocardia hierapolitana TaxID=1128676 RepID=UPI001FE43A7B|nr:hypothetical protein [Pseudonocardia hierapolitana]